MRKNEIKTIIELPNNYHVTIKFTPEVSDIEITFLHTCIQGRKIKKESILDVRTHFKPTETHQYTHFSFCHPPGVRKGFIKGKALRILKQTLQKQHLKKTLLYSNRDYATEVTPITLQIKLSQKLISAKESVGPKKQTKNATKHFAVCYGISPFCA